MTLSFCSHQLACRSRPIRFQPGQRTRHPYGRELATIAKNKNLAQSKHRHVTVGSILCNDNFQLPYPGHCQSAIPARKEHISLGYDQVPFSTTIIISHPMLCSLISAENLYYSYQLILQDMGSTTRELLETVLTSVLPMASLAAVSTATSGGHNHQIMATPSTATNSSAHSASGHTGATPGSNTPDCKISVITPPRLSHPMFFPNKRLTVADMGCDFSIACRCYGTGTPSTPASSRPSGA